MRSFSFSLLTSILCGTAMLGCSKTETSVPSAEGTAFRLVKEPDGAKGVKAARADAKPDQELTIVGRIGGDANPWVEGQAAFMVVDTALKPCADDEGCPTPWDYCCSTDELPASKAMVKVVDASGKPVATDARKLLGLKELQTVVIHGKAKRDDAGNLTVLADGVFVRK